MNLHGHILITQSPEVALEFTLGVVPSVGLDEWIHHDSGTPSEFISTVSLHGPQLCQGTRTFSSPFSRTANPALRGNAVG